MPSPDALARLDRAIEPHLGSVLTPALLIDLDAVEHNVRAVVERVGRPDRWRPHIKTVKQAVVLEVLLRNGVRHFKVATTDELALLLRTAAREVPEAHVDVLVAYPLGEAACRAALRLRRTHPDASVALLADSPEHLRALDGWVVGEDRQVDVHLDINLGMDRTGSPEERWRAAPDAITGLQRLRVIGLHGYDGHLTWTERARAHRGYDILCELARRLPVPDLREVVTSGTHSYAHALTHEGLRSGAWSHQVSPGTVVLSDLRSIDAAADLGLRQAAYVATRVVSTPVPGRITLDAGSKAVAPDRPAPGCAVLGHPDLEPLRRSEEHMPVAVKDAGAPSRGALLWLVPEHVCTTVNLYRRALWLRGDTIVGDGPIEAMSHPLWG